MGVFCFKSGTPKLRFYAVLCKFTSEYILSKVNFRIHHPILKLNSHRQDPQRLRLWDAKLRNTLLHVGSDGAQFNESVYVVLMI